MAEIDFNYSGKESADTYAKHLSQSMNDEYDRDHIISHGVSSWKLNKQDVKDVIECLDRTKARIFVATRDFEGLEIEDNWEKETWYGTDYAQNQLDLNHISVGRLLSHHVERVDRPLLDALQRRSVLAIST